MHFWIAMLLQQLIAELMGLIAARRHTQLGKDSLLQKWILQYFFMWSLFPVCYHFVLLVQLEYSSLFLLLFNKICKTRYYLQGLLAVVNLKELNTHINFCHIKRLNAWRAPKHQYHDKVSSQKVLNSSSEFLISGRLVQKTRDVNFMTYFFFFSILTCLITPISPINWRNIWMKRISTTA